MARQKKLTAKLAQKILDYFADGFTIREVFLKDDVDITWSNFRNYLIADDSLMLRYQKSRELAVDLKLSELEDKRKILEDKIERGDLDGGSNSPTYAQDDPHMRKMEMEAYLKGNLLFRDWEDKVKN